MKTLLQWTLVSQSLMRVAEEVHDCPHGSCSMAGNEGLVLFRHIKWGKCKVCVIPRRPGCFWPQTEFTQPRLCPIFFDISAVSCCCGCAAHRKGRIRSNSLCRHCNDDRVSVMEKALWVAAMARMERRRGTVEVCNVMGENGTIKCRLSPSFSTQTTTPITRNEWSYWRITIVMGEEP